MSDKEDPLVPPLKAPAPPPVATATTGRNGSFAADSIVSALSAVQLEGLEHRYVEVLRELNAEPKLLPFKTEYEKIHRLLNKSHEGETRIISKIHELRNELASYHAKIDSAMELSKGDEKVIANLHHKLEEAWATSDTAQAREKESLELIKVLQKQVADLDVLVEQSAGLSMGQEAYLRDLLATKKEREEEHSQFSIKVTRLSAEHHEILTKLRKIQEEDAIVRSDLEHRMSAYQSMLAELESQQKERQGKEQSVREYRSSTEKLVIELEKRRELTETLVHEETKLRKEAVDLNDLVESLIRQLDEKQRRFKAEADRLSAVEVHNMQLKKEIPKKQTVVKERERELAKSKKNLKQLESTAKNQQGDLQSLVDARESLIHKNNEYTSQIDTLLIKLAQEEKTVQGIETELKKAMKDKTRTIANNSSKENERAQVEGQRVLEEGKSRRLAQELEGLLTENEAMRKSLFELELKQSKELGAAQTVMLDYHKTLDHIRSKRQEAKHLRDVCGMHEKKQKVQQELLERVVTDRNRTEKQLKETETEWGDLKEQHGSKLEEIERMKSDLISKEGALCQLHTVIKQLQRDTANTEQRASHLREDCNHAHSRIEALQAEAHQLNQVIANCDAEKMKQQMRLSSITNERNVLATQLIRRNEELRLLYDKIQLQQSALDKGAMDYEQRVKELLQTRDKLLETRLRCRIALVRLQYMDRLKHKELRMDKALLRTRGRVRALTDELQCPVNVHRWRQMEGSAPDLLDGIAKVQMLQRKVLAKCDECDSKKHLISEKESQYALLRRKLARLPGPEAAEDLALFHENLEKREDQIHGMSDELTDVQQHAEVLGEEVRQLNSELHEVKGKYFLAKAKHEALRRERLALRQTWGGTSAVANIAIAATHGPSSSYRGDGDLDSPPNTGDGAQMRLSAPQRFLSSSGGMRMSNVSPTTSQRVRALAREQEVMKVLSTGREAPNYPLQKPKNQRQFVGGGFALTR